VRALFTVLLFVTVAWADSSLDAEVERYLAETETPTIPLRVYWTHAPRAESADEAIKFHLRGRVLFDTYGAGSNDYAANLTESATYFRQVRFGFDGSFAHNGLFGLEIEFSNGTPRLRDVYVGVRNLPVLGAFQAGNIRHAFGLDAMTPIPFHTFMERAPSTRAFQTGRDLGLRFHNSHFDDRLTWVAGVYALSDSTAVASNTGHAGTVRIAGIPARSFDDERAVQVGFGFDYEVPTDGTVKYRSRPGPNQGPHFIDTGDVDADAEMRFALSVAINLNSLVLQMEGYHVRILNDAGDPALNGAYVHVVWWITGERPAYVRWWGIWGRTVPTRNLGDGGGTGAWMVGLRYDWTDLNDGVVQGGEMQTLTAGLTWMWNPNSRVVLNGVYADVASGPFGPGDVYYVSLRFQVDY